MEFDAYAASVPLNTRCAVAAEVTDAITIGTAIAVAFPRSPMVTA